MMRSRLRRPTSKSMTATFLPRLARPTASEALVVVLPTPPLPEVTTMISVKGLSSGWGMGNRRSGQTWMRQSQAHRRRFRPRRFCQFPIPAPESQFFQQQLVAVKPRLHGFAAQVRWNVLEHAVVAGDRDQFGVEF